MEKESETFNSCVLNLTSLFEINVRLWLSDFLLSKITSNPTFTKGIWSTTLFPAALNLFIPFQIGVILSIFSRMKAAVSAGGTSLTHLFLLSEEGRKGGSAVRTTTPSRLFAHLSHKSHSVSAAKAFHQEPQKEIRGEREEREEGRQTRLGGVRSARSGEVQSERGKKKRG